MKKITITPSIICGEMLNLEKDIIQYENLGFELLHGDFIDGYFSPSLPLGIDTIKAVAHRSNIPMSLHIMSIDVDNTLKLLEGTQLAHITFHVENTVHTDRLLKFIKSKGMKAGIALTPSTPPEVVRYVLPECDIVTLMLINPGYAWEETEAQIPYALEKIRDTKDLLRKVGSCAEIELDGRIALEDIPVFAQAGASIFVSGSSGLFKKGHSMQENYQMMKSFLNKHNLDF